MKSRSAPKLVVVTTSVATAAQADKLASAIVEQHLAACVQRVPMRSTYRWKGKTERAREHLLIIKTRAACVTELIAFIRRTHTYTLPEILVTPVSGGLPDYIMWVTAETTTTRPRRAPATRKRHST
ncbi:MAG: divalent-cation tolerance protein CutA [Verrucomicrobia bacterium]|nr:divalent-cation tolerance protein CutA [Verrucomicrobiota bacterium]